MDPVEFYELGIDVRKRLSDATKGKATISQLAGKLRLPMDMLYKARDFANQFSKAESRQFKKLGVSKSHVSEVLRLSDKSQQIDFLEKAANKKWSVRKLRAKIQASEGVRNFGGRSVEEKTIFEILSEIRILCRRSEAYVDQLDDQDFFGLSEEKIRRLKQLRTEAQWLYDKLLG